MFRFGLVGLISLAVVGASEACSVPVFRYALEKWSPSTYELLVFHRGPLNTSEQKTLFELKDSAHRMNLAVVSVDLTQEDEANADRRAICMREGKDAALPWVALRYPDTKATQPSAWTGPLSASPKLLDSPARQAIADRLTAGNAGVVILLLSGDAKADEAARIRLREQLPQIATGIELPAHTDDGPQVASLLPLRVAFPVVEVARTQAEDTLVRLLIGSEEGLEKEKGPIVFPVFGRGRALCSLHGKDLEKPSELKRAMEFLCRACSCQVKELNPGVDLLIAANWELIFEAEAGPAPRVPGETPPSAEPHPASGSGPIPAESRKPPPRGYEAAEVDDHGEVAPRRFPWFRYAGIAGVLTLLSSYWAFRNRRPAPPNTPDGT